MEKFRFVLSVLALSWMVLLFQNCDGGSGVTVGNPLSVPPGGVETEDTIEDSVVEATKIAIDNFSLSYEQWEVTDIELCIESIQFNSWIELDEATLASRFVRIGVGEESIALQPGITIGEFSVADLNYDYATLELGYSCGNSNVISFNNSSGSFIYNDTIYADVPVVRLKVGAEVTYTLKIQGFINEIAQVADVTEIPFRMENTTETTAAGQGSP